MGRRKGVFNSQRSQWNPVGDKWNIAWGNCIFIGNLIGCWFAVYFHFQLGGKHSSLPLWTSFTWGGEWCRIVFPHYCGCHRLWFDANQFVFVVCWYFASLRILCRHVVILPISMWTLQTRVDALMLISPTPPHPTLPPHKLDFFPFNDLLPNWYWSLFPAWFYKIFNFVWYMYFLKQSDFAFGFISLGTLL